MQEIQFAGAKKKEQESSYVPYMPGFVKTALAITGSWSTPIITAEGAPKSAVYEIDGVRLRAYLKLTSEDGSSLIETPLAMCHYVNPDGDSIYDIEICKEATITNSIRELHNGFVVKIINEFMTLNDCGTSAGKLCMPSAPKDCVKARLEEISKFTKDKLGTSRKSIEYLAERQLYCGRDFNFEDAFEKANEVSFTELCKKRAENAKASGRKGIRVTLEGRIPSWWDGESPTDSAGVRVMWKMGKGHTFMTPELCVVENLTPVERAPDQLLLMGQTEEPSSSSSDEEEEETFDSVFRYTPSKTLQLPAPPPVGIEEEEETVAPAAAAAAPDSVVVIIEDETPCPSSPSESLRGRSVFDRTTQRMKMNGDLPAGFFDD